MVLFSGSTTNTALRSSPTTKWRTWNCWLKSKLWRSDRTICSNGKVGTGRFWLAGLSFWEAVHLMISPRVKSWRLWCEQESRVSTDWVCGAGWYGSGPTHCARPTLTFSSNSARRAMPHNTRQPGRSSWTCTERWPPTRAFHHPLVPCCSSFREFSWRSLGKTLLSATVRDSTGTRKQPSPSTGLSEQ